MDNNIVRHILLFRFKAATTEAQINTMVTVFREMTGKIPGIVSFEFGANNSPEGFNRGMTHALMVTFVNAQARDAYLPHPEHRKFGEWFSGLGIIDELLVIDYTPQND